MVIDKPGTNTRKVVAYLAFFLSGASSLIFQTIWSSELRKVFGATSLAIGTVLTVFMAGLGLGAWIAGRYANRIRQPILTYAFAEIGVGVWGLLIPFLVTSDGWLASVNSALRIALGDQSAGFMVARFLCVVPILIVPTTLMGSTLPLLTRHFVSMEQDARTAGANVGVLYAINTFGASTGPLLSGFILMPTVGRDMTNYVACSMNFGLAFLIFVAFAVTYRRGQSLRFWPEKTSIDEPPPPPPVVEEKPEESELEPQTAPEPELESAPAGTEVSSDAPFAEVRPKEAVVGAYRDAPPLIAADKEEAKAAAKEITSEPLPKPAAKRRRKKKGTAKKPAPAIKVRPRRKRVDLAEAPIPELARKAAFLAFAASGAASLCYEVVWSRALAMTIGSSIYSFVLILETFLVGIAVGSAAMAAFLGRKSAPYFGLALTSIALIALANVPWALDIVDPANRTQRTFGSWTNYGLLTALYAGPVILAAVFATVTASREKKEEESFRDNDAWRPILSVLMAAMPVIAAGVNTLRFPGYFPKIVLSVVAAIAVFLVIASLLHRAPTLLLAIVQLFIAGATTVSYVWQDEVPRAFAQLVVSIPQTALADHVGTVKFFMFLTIMLCTLPATLGMGAMFPLTLRVWTSGGKKIATDVASVYSANTVGSIIGAWLPGFVLFALIGAERTLNLGIVLNMGLALFMLIAGVADPNEDQSFWSWRRLSAIALPTLLALFLLSSAYPVVIGDWRWWSRVVGGVLFGGLAVAEYMYLKARVEGAPWAQAASLPITIAPLALGIGLALFMVDVGEHDPWARTVAFGALRIFAFATAATIAWVNFREQPKPVAPIGERATP
jgi:MFS family permease